MAHWCSTSGTKNDETIDVCIAIDTSGSIRDEQVKVFLGEVQNIMSQYADYNIKIWCFDTNVTTNKIISHMMTALKITKLLAVAEQTLWQIGNT